MKGYKTPYAFISISEYHKFRGLPAPEHPLISVVDFEDLILEEDEPYSITSNFYSIALKRHPNTTLIYGQQQYDFDDGVLLFLAPRQVFGIKTNSLDNPKGWMLMVHPDFFWGSSLAKKIKGYEFFSYSVNEALFLSEKEEQTLNAIVSNVESECSNNLDRFSQQIIISQIETLLNYSERYYERQFLTRKVSSHQILEKLEDLLNNYFKNNNLKSLGLPTVQFVSDQLNLSAGYLSSLLKAHTGQSTQQHIHQKIIEVAKEKLSTTNLSVSEVAFELGFDYPQSFSKLFKSKTELSPTQFKQSF
ncbi:helix-turn-helix domain-containing protein [Autumnicola musiva]|uniref:Helix-turn-helix domain-containing protein n=1 Tax=Autumnicola musiva TaxID=3075589 RepID=A0ABU3D8T9_9FLAO|nr:helix-turn-helix domain-containing protein [Zunongwangia sp. F117]MDT0677938.1 helix-turn-helix domain-containing protein [Zunongwangia sp. F117]